MAIAFPNFMHLNPEDSHIRFFWSDDVELSVLQITQQFVHVDIHIKYNNWSSLFTCVYADCEKHVRRGLWDDLISISHNHAKPCCW